MRKYFVATLLDNVIISQRAASLGSHDTLSYLPGATFLGAVAKQLYEKLPPSEQLTIFHSGKVRFCDALPVNEGSHAGYPVPLCWHYQKGDKEEERSISNHQHSNREDQPKQYRDEFFTHFREKHQFFKPFGQLALKTAIKLDTGTAADKQLFFCAALPKNSVFWGKLEADNGSIAPARFDELLAILQNGLRLGRSRSAEYGQVAIELLDDKQVEQFKLIPPDPIENQEVTLWLLSDTALQDEFGQPTLHPNAIAVGLPTHFNLELRKTYVRSRHYAPFNGKRQRRELERQVLMAGSVLHFTSDIPASAECLKMIQEHGIGLYRQSGLGQIWINPDLLANPEPKFPPPLVKNRLDTSSDAILQELTETDGISYKIWSYLDQRQKQSSSGQEIEKIARKLLGDLRLAYRSAREFEPYLVGVCIGPSKNQWSRVMEAAQQCIQKKESIQNLRNSLFLGERAICKEGDLQWSQRVFVDKQIEVDNFRKWLEKQFDDKQDNSLLLRIIARFARLAMDVAEKEACNHPESKGNKGAN